MSDTDASPRAEFLSDVDMATVNQELSGLILSVRVLERRIAASAMTGAQVVDAFAEMFPPADLFSPEICSFKAIHSSLRDWLLANGATLDRHRSGRIMMQLVGIYSDDEDKVAAEVIVNKIISAGRRTAKPEEDSSSAALASSSGSDSHAQYKIAQGISMRFKDKDAKFSGALGERWMDYVAEFQQVARDFGISASQKKQYLHNLLRDDAKRFYLDRIDNDVNLYSEAVRLIEDEYNSIVRQNRVKNFLSSLRISNYTKDGMDEPAALEKVYKIVTKLSSQVPPAYRGETHKIEFLRNSTVGYDWATQPLSRVATHNLSFQQLYGELEFQLHLAREAKLANVRDKVSGLSAADQDESTVPGILYQGPGRYARSQKNLGSWRSSASTRASSNHKKFNPLTVMGCFNCDDPGHMINQCTKPVDLTKAAKRKMEYLSKKTGRTRNAHVVLFELCHQLEVAQVDPNPTQETATADVHVTERDDNVDDFDLFDALLSTTADVGHSDVTQTPDVAEDFGILFQRAYSAADSDISVYLTSRHSAMAAPMFHGACLDTGAQRSVIGKNQAVAYYRFMGLPLVLSQSRRNVYRFGSQKRVSVGKAKLRVPYAGDKHMHMELDVVDIDIPLLFGLDLLDKFKLVVDNVDNMLRCKTPSWSVPIVRKFGHLYYEWPYNVMYSIPELRKIHRHFYHPEPRRLFNVLKQANDPHATPATLAKLEQVSSACDVCQRLCKEPGRFRVALPHDDVVFNRCVLMDIMSLESCNVLHVICKDTLFSAAVFMEGDKTRDVWGIYLRFWVHAYVGYSKSIHADRGPQFNSDEWRHLLQSAGIERRDSGVESHNALGVGEKYHDFLRRIFRKVRFEHPVLPKEDCLSLAVHAMNNTAGPHGLVPTLLVFGVVPQLPLGFADLPEQRQRMQALHKARREMTKYIATSRLRTALSRNVPAAADRSILIGSRVLCFKEKGKVWEGPYEVIAGDGKQLWVDIKGELKLISIDKLRSYIPPIPDHTGDRSPCSTSSTPGNTSPENLSSTASADNVAERGTEARKRLPWISSDSDDDSDAPFDRVITGENLLSNVFDILHSVRKSTEGTADVIETPTPILLVDRVPHSDPRSKEKRFEEAKRAEVAGLIRRDVWRVVPSSSIPSKANIIGARFDLTIKNAGTDREKAKARFIGQGYKDELKDFIVHSTPTLRQSSTRIILSSAAVLGFRLSMVDFVQAYLQSQEKLSRKIYLKVKDDDRRYFNINPGDLLELQKPLYGICDSGDYWGATFESYIRTEAGMSSLDGDPSLYILEGSSGTTGLLGAYVDDNLFAGTQVFDEVVQRTAARFESKPVEKDNLEFVGLRIETKTRKDGRRYFLGSQPEYCNNLDELPKSPTFSLFSSVRAALGWLTHSRPDICCAVNRACQVTEDLFDDKRAAELSAAIAYVKGTPEVRLQYQPLDRASLHLRAYADASFASNLDLSSQLGFIILLCDDSNRCHVLNFSSRKSRRKVRSIMAGETYAFTTAFDLAYILKHDLERVLRQPIALKMFTDSKQLFDVITRASHTTEKRLMIDIASAREAYKNFEISNVGLVAGTENPADGLTKPRVCKQLYDLLRTGKDETVVSQWIIRTK